MIVRAYPLVFALLFLISCAPPVEKKVQLVGTPPKPGEDPFSETRIFTPYEEVPTSGSLSESLDDAITDIPPTPASTPKRVQQPESPRVIHCYSCAEICRTPKSEPESLCSLGKEEICGWGASKDKPSATLMATEQCRLTLEKLTGHSDLQCSNVYCE